MKSIYYDPNLQEVEKNRRWFKNVKLIGELDEGTSLYIEDYVYTYLYQYANGDLSCERSAVLIGEYHKESDQVVIYGMIPIDSNLLISKEKWISTRILGEIEGEKERYFPKGEYVGWMHTQPGYGIMTTTQEVGVHKEVFGETCVLMLIDPIYNAETFFTYKDGDFIGKQGFCMYYEKNESMQKYMADNPIIEREKQKENDEAVVSFREMGARRKKEVERKRRINMVVSFTIMGILLTTAFITGIYSQQRKINNLEKDVVSIHQQYSEIEHRLRDNPVEVVFTSSKTEPKVEPEARTELEVKVEPEAKTESKVEAEVEAEPEPEEKPVVVEKDKVKPEYDIHAVEIGDSLLGISYNHYKTVTMAKKIAELNSIENHDAIYIGQKLKLPKIGQ